MRTGRLGHSPTESKSHEGGALLQGEEAPAQKLGSQVHLSSIAPGGIGTCA